MPSGRRARRPGSSRAVAARSLAAELGEQRLALPFTEATQTTAGRDLEALHRLLRTYLAHARQSLQQSRDLHLAEHLVLVGLLQHISEGRTAALEPLLELRAGATGGGGLPPPRSTLFLGELGKCHVSLRYYSKFWVGVATVPTPDLDSQCGGER